MPSHYVWSGAGGTGDGLTWANAYTKLSQALATPAEDAGVYVAHDHAETSATAVNLNSTGSLYNPKRVVCANRAGATPPLPADRRATAVVSVTGTNFLTFSGSSHFDGVIFNCGAGTAGNIGIILHATNNHVLRFDNCSLRLTAGIPVQGTIFVGGSTGALSGTCVELNNTTMQFSQTNQTVSIVNGFRWRNTPTALLGAVMPNKLLMPFIGKGGYAELIGVDLSAVGSGKTLCDVASGAQGFRFTFTDCKINASVIKTSLGIDGHGSFSTVDFTRTSATGNFAFYRLNMTGDIQQTTSFYRNGGASDGTTPISWLINAGFNANWSTPFETPPIAIWNDRVTLPVTASVECMSNGSAMPRNDEVWLEVEYLGSAASPLASFASNGKSDLLTLGSIYTASTAPWTGLSTHKFKPVVTFTPQQRGWIFARVKIARPSNTYYVDPVVTLS